MAALGSREGRSTVPPAAEARGSGAGQQQPVPAPPQPGRDAPGPFAAAAGAVPALSATPYLSSSPWPSGLPDGLCGSGRALLSGPQGIHPLPLPSSACGRLSLSLWESANKGSLPCLAASFHKICRNEVFLRRLFSKLAVALDSAAVMSGSPFYHRRQHCSKNQTQEQPGRERGTQRPLNELLRLLRFADFEG